MNELITDLTSWIPWPWLQNLVTIGLYMGILAAIGTIPFIAWLGWASASTARRTAGED